MKMWSEIKGKGEPLLMLHPGAVDSRAFEPIEPMLSAKFTLHYIDRRAHGRTKDVDGSLHFDDMVYDVIEYIEAEIKEPVNIFGYSDGAVVALLLTMKRPDLIKKAVCASGVYHYNGWQDGVLESLSTAPDFLKQSYGEVSPDGIDHYEAVMSKMYEMHKSEPALTKDELRTFDNQCLVMAADDDEVKLEHTIEWYYSLKNGELCIMPGTSHGMFAEKPELFSEVLIDFYQRSPIQTFAPRLRG